MLLYVYGDLLCNSNMFVDDIIIYLENPWTKRLLTQK